MATDTNTTEPPIDYDGVLCIDELSRILKTGEATIRRRLKDKTFPIPPLPGGIDNRFRWAGPVVRRWLDENGGTLPDEHEPRGRR